MLSNRSLASFIVLAAVLVLSFLPACKAKPPVRPVAAPPVPAIPPKPKPPPPPKPAPPLTVELDPHLARIDAVARQEMASGGFPGAVILVGHQGAIVYRKAFGYRSLVPQRQPMTTDTIFDLASLTKVVATTTAIMQLADAGRLRLDDPVGKYWPAFAMNGKRGITIKQLLTHTSGLRAEVNPKVRWYGYEGAVEAIARDHSVRPPGTSFQYSDANFIALGEVVHRVSGLPLDAYCKQKIFKPLYKDYIDLAHQAGKKIFMHSDGYIFDIYGDMIELGLDAINSQLFIMDIEEIGKQFGGQITFWGEIDRQHLLSHGTTGQITDAVQRVKDALYKDGGVIAQCEFGPGARPENVEMVFQAWDDVMLKPGEKT